MSRKELKYTYSSVKSPCKGCCDRYVGCHGSCTGYKAYHDELNRIRAKEFEFKRLENMCNSILSRATISKDFVGLY